MIPIPVVRETFGHARGFHNFHALNEFTTLYPNPSALSGCRDSTSSLDSK
jgi:hypothetical protein